MVVESGHGGGKRITKRLLHLFQKMWGLLPRQRLPTPANPEYPSLTIRKFCSALQRGGWAGWDLRCSFPVKVMI